MKACSLQNLIIDHQKNKVLAEFVHDQFRGMVLSPHYPCVGAKSSFNRNAYLFGLHEEIGADRSTKSLFSDLYRFTHVYQRSAGVPSTFVASFKAANVTSELQFEKLLWKQLGMLHSMDISGEWNESFSSDPESAHFSFSIFKKAFFVVGLHPMSSRWSRRFAWPTLIFNDQDQFKHLKEQGTYSRMESVNRQRDKKLQGFINPNLTDSHAAFEARQYSGRHVEKDWKCPFHVLDEPNL